MQKNRVGQVTKKYLFGMALALCLSVPAMAEKPALPMDLTVGNYTAHVNPNGTFSVDNNGYTVFETQALTISNDKWEVLYGGGKLNLTPDMSKGADGSTIVRFTENKEGIVDLVETVTFRPSEVEISYKYDLKQNIGHFVCDIKLPTSTYEGAGYKADMYESAAKSGTFPVGKPEKVVINYDGLTTLKNLHAESKAGPIDFAFSPSSTICWTLGDHRAADWVQSFCLWNENPCPAGKNEFKTNIKMGGR